jgi:hypothetical protein
MIMVVRVENDEIDRTVDWAFFSFSFPLLPSLHTFTFTLSLPCSLFSHLVNAGRRNRNDVTDETVGTSVFHPVVVGVDRTTEFATLFSVRYVLRGRVDDVEGRGRSRSCRLCCLRRRR